MLARPLDGDELDGLLTALRRVEERLGDPARLALIDRHLSGRTAAPIETVATAAAAAMLIGRMLPLVADEEVRADLEAPRRSYVGSSTAPIRNSVLPSGPLIGLSTTPRTQTGRAHR